MNILVLCASCRPEQHGFRNGVRVETAEVLDFSVLAQKGMFARDESEHHIFEALAPNVEQLFATLDINQDQEFDGSFRKRVHQDFNEIRDQGQLTTSVASSHKNTRLRRRHLLVAIEAVHAPLEVGDGLRIGDVVVPETASPPTATVDRVAIVISLSRARGSRRSRSPRGG